MPSTEGTAMFRELDRRQVLLDEKMKSMKSLEKSIDKDITNIRGDVKTLEKREIRPSKQT